MSHWLVEVIVTPRYPLGVIEIYRYLPPVPPPPEVATDLVDSPDPRRRIVEQLRNVGGRIVNNLKNTRLRP